MKAIVCTRYGPPEVLRLEEVLKPRPKPNEVCVKIHATTISGSDIIVRSGRLPSRSMWLLMRLALGFTGPRSRVLGFVLAGEVEAAGTEVKRFKAGDPVFGVTIKSPTQPRAGTYAQYKCLPEESVLAFKPVNLGYEEAAAIPYGGLLALHFLRKGGLASGQRVLVNGASGAVGSSAVQLAKHLGATVTGVCSTANLGLVRSLGADAVVDYTQEDCTRTEERYDLILDAVPAGKADRRGFRSKCQKILSPSGRHLSIDDGRPEMSLAGLTLLAELAESGRLKPVIGRRYPLEQTAEAHRHVETGHKVGNVIITVAHDQ